MDLKAVKFGGTSLCDARQMRKAAGIVQTDATRRVIVVSAPGKRNANDEKLTDLLYRCYDAHENETFETLFSVVRSRIDEMTRELAPALDFSEEYEEMRYARLGCLGRDYFVSRGEYFAARMMAELLHFRFLDATELIFFDENGTVMQARARAVLRPLLEQERGVVIPGFYGRTPGDTVRTFARGGSDITGAIAADAAGALVYENFTDVSGFHLTDPKILDKPEIVSIISYKELRRLSVMGANVLHEDAVLPARASGIPIHILNTNRPADAGTWIVPKKEKTGTVCGVAGKGGFSKLVVERDKLGEDAAMLRTLLGILERKRISVWSMPHTPDAVAVLIRTEDIRDCRDYLLHELCQWFEPETVRLEDGIALVCVIGEAMPAQMLPKIFSAVASVGEKPVMLDCGADEMGVTIGVREEALSPVICAICRAIR